MDKARKKELRQAYRLAPPPMGIYTITNKATGRTLLDASANLEGAFNRHRMELRLGVHRNRPLMADWRQFGEAQFAFEVAERLKPRTEPDFDPAAELARLLARWQTKLPPGSAGSYR